MKPTSWLTSTMVSVLLSSRRISKRQRSAWLSTFAVGSSIRRIFGEPISARAISMRCSCPPESAEICRPARSARSKVFSSSDASASRRFRSPGTGSRPVFPPSATQSSAVIGKSRRKFANCGT